MDSNDRVQNSPRPVSRPRVRFVRRVVSLEIGRITEVLIYQIYRNGEVIGRLELTPGYEMTSADIWEVVSTNEKYHWWDDIYEDTLDEVKAAVRDAIFSHG